MCREFSNVVKSLSEEYKWDVMAIKIDDADDLRFRNMFDVYEDRLYIGSNVRIGIIEMMMIN